MINLTDGIKSIEVYYDGRCGMCCTFHEWLNRQDRANKVLFFPYQDTATESQFPGINSLEPDKEMIVRVDGTDVYRGAEAWIWCLWSCSDYRVLAEKMNRPLFLPFAKKVCHLLAANRLSLSKVFFRKKAKEVAEDLHSMPQIEREKGMIQNRSRNKLK